MKFGTMFHGGFPVVAVSSAPLMNAV